MGPKEDQCLVKKAGDRGLRRGGRVVYCTVLPPCHAEGSSSEALELRHLGVCPGHRAAPGEDSLQTADVWHVGTVVLSAACPVLRAWKEAGQGLVQGRTH